MSQSTIKALAKIIAETASSTTIAPAPALRRCRAAWQRAFNASMAANGNRSEYTLTAESDAAQAYCNAMPVPSGFNGIHDFIACAAHGILIGAIPPEKSGQLLYAAQVAISTLPHGPKPPKAPSKKEPLPPGTSKNPPQVTTISPITRMESANPHSTLFTYR